MRDFRIQSKRMIAASVIVAITAVGGCATAPDDPEAPTPFGEANDPLEPVNRWVFNLNMLLDKAILRPATQAYNLLPKTPRQGVTNVLRNIDSPVTLANDLMQLKPERAAITAGRFVVNSTLGIGGLFDVASSFGWERHSEDFGQTLGYFGVPEGPYLVLPIVGPAPPRDAIGRVVDYFHDPITYLGKNSRRWEWVPPTRFALEAVDFQSRNFDQIDEIERTSIDLYATVRSAYRQSRNDEIRDGAPGPLVPVPQISIDFSDGKTAATTD